MPGLRLPAWLGGHRHPIAEPAWQRAEGRLALLAGLSNGERQQLRSLAARFLAKKAIEPVGDLWLGDDERAELALQACLPILNLGLAWYSGWASVVVYPDTFLADHETVDELGIRHSDRHVLGGESWQRGPLVLSWPDARDSLAEPGQNLVIHEASHKLDMLNGAANGMPPLHRSMDRRRWTAAFQAAYEDLQRRLDTGQGTAIDPYAGEDPAEFFSVVSEAFFDAPHGLRSAYPGIYELLAVFYRQDPAARLPAVGP